MSISTQNHAGCHLLIDFYGVDATLLGDLSFVQKACEDAAAATGATILGSNFHHFGDGHGLSGVVLLAESHLSVHSWPERNFAAFDVFVCGVCDPQAAVPVLLDRFSAEASTVKTYLRGELWERFTE